MQKNRDKDRYVEESCKDCTAEKDAQRLFCRKGGVLAAVQKKEVKTAVWKNKGKDGSSDKEG